MSKTWISDGDFYLNNDGNLVEIVQDDCYCCESPRDWGCKMGTFYIWSRSVCSPDDDRPEDFIELGERFDMDIDDSPTQFINEFNAKHGVAMPVWIIDHSGVTYRCDYTNPFNDPWDSGLGGVIFATNEHIKEMYCIDDVNNEVRSRVRREFVDEVNEYNDWACGNIHGFVVYDKSGMEIDSCFGFIGDDPDNIAYNCNGLNECEFTSVDEFAEAHKNDAEVIIDRINAMLVMVDRKLDEITELYQTITERGIKHEVINGRIKMLEA